MGLRDPMLRNRTIEVTAGGPQSDYPGFTSMAVQLAVDEATRHGGGMATNACPNIEAVDVDQVRVRNLAIDGNKAANEPIGGCRGGGIYLKKARDCMIERVIVRDFNGDGIRWQITENISVLHCET